MSRELPILCTAPAVRAILDGRQTQTRRLVLVPWGKRSKALPFEPYYTDDDGTLMAADEAGDWHVFAEWGRKPWRPSDVLYVRETWAPHNAAHPKTRVDFRADMMSWGRTSEGEWMFPEPLNNSKLPAPARPLAPRHPHAQVGRPHSPPRAFHRCRTRQHHQRGRCDGGGVRDDNGVRRAVGSSIWRRQLRPRCLVLGDTV